jgi:hypothetical protein
VTEVDLSEFRTPRSTTKCIVGRVIESLDETDRAKLAAAMNEPEIRSRMIHNFLLSRGHSLAYSNVPIHRSGDCRCD